MNDAKKNSCAILIERAILDGKFKPGDRLPPERELALHYGVSRSILREAMRHLSGLGLLRTVPQSGTYVTDYRREASIELLVHLMDNTDSLDHAMYRAVNELREMLETGCAERAAALSSAEGVMKLRKLHASMAVEGISPGIVAERDFSFHEQVVEMTGNIALRLLFNAFRKVYIFYASRFYEDPEHLVLTLRQLERFILMIEEGDGPGAAAVYREALVYGREEVSRQLEKEGWTE